MFYFNPQYLFFMVPAILAMLAAQLYVNSTYRKWGKIPTSSGATGMDTVRRILSISGMESIAFPSISTGAYGYPVEQAAEVALAAVVAFLSGDSPVEEVRFVLFDSRTHDAYAKALDSLGVGG